MSLFYYKGDPCGSEGYTEKDISYDELGNIKSLTRGSADPYVYSYTGNKLNSVTGLTSGSYIYDGNGNMSHDARNNNDIVYNNLNLPQAISGSDAITYVYAADGTKLRKLSTTNTDYIDGIQYKDDGTIDFIQTEEGRAVKSGTDYVYEYTLTDHLGNNRVTFNQTDGQLGEDDYYPFGKNVYRLENAGNKYLYNKKELQDELTQYDYGARFYDPVIARWTSVDPAAEKSRRFSPYVYGENNPILNVDPDGMQTQGCCLTPPLLGTKYAKAAAKLIINTVAFFTNFIDAENSHRAFSKDPAVRAEAKRELNGYLAAGAVMVMTDGLMGRIAGTFGTSVTSNSVWALDASERGFAVEQMLGGNLPYGFPVIDKFNPETGVATSIKSIDVTADSYTKGNGLFNTLKSYVNKLDGFQGATRGNFSVEGGDITSKVLEVGIQPGKATLSQWEQIGNAMKYAKDNNIDFKLQFVK